jgi:hypothetical protein
MGKILKVALGAIVGVAILVFALLAGPRLMRAF